MELQAAEQLAWRLMREFGLTVNGWMFYWSNSKRKFGTCSENKRRIRLSRPMTLLNPEADVDDTIRHEIAHALAGHDAGHGPTWKHYCKITGARPERCCEDVIAPKGSWEAHCPGCKSVHYKYRRPKMGKRTACLACCRQHNRGRFTLRFELIYHWTGTQAYVKQMAQAAVACSTAQPEISEDRRLEMEQMKKRIAELEAQLRRK
jgi:predicted SprT family Zn-dependent metalloprotease